MAAPRQSQASDGPSSLATRIFSSLRRLAAVLHDRRLPSRDAPNRTEDSPQFGSWVVSLVHVSRRGRPLPVSYAHVVYYMWLDLWGIYVSTHVCARCSTKQVTDSMQLMIILCIKMRITIILRIVRRALRDKTQYLHYIKWCLLYNIYNSRLYNVFCMSYKIQHVI